MLADELFLIAWDTTSSGKPRLHVQGVALGLAGALLAELVLHSRVAVQGATIRVADRRPVGETVADAVLADMAGSPQHTDVRTWLAYLAQRSITDVAGRMIAAGRLEREAPRLIKRKVSRYYAPDFGQAMWPRTRLNMALVRWQPLAAEDMALAVLVDSCGMTDVVVDDPAERKIARRYLTTVLAALPQPLADLGRHVSAAVGDAVLTYRS
ncbi:GPP34 family phosphoprotein [Nonomuraea sp. NPDC050310]|uniref:GOLPH3/VPS74 family protein n=1 Tax=unclassified Nonomuraea TaxID=2593643 RepID=UPI0033CC6FA3